MSPASLTLTAVIITGGPPTTRTIIRLTIAIGRNVT